MKWLILKLVHFYRLAMSPWLGPRCRFHPSCSTYALEAIENFGAFKGVLLTVKRVLKCHPFHPGGYDPPPSKEEKLQ